MSNRLWVRAAMLILPASKFDLSSKRNRLLGGHEALELGPSRLEPVRFDASLERNRLQRRPSSETTQVGLLKSSSYLAELTEFISSPIPQATEEVTLDR